MGRKRLFFRIFLVALVFILVLLTPSVYRGLRGKEVPLPVSSGVQPSECNVQSLRRIGAGAHPKWSTVKNFIVFDSRLNGFYEIFTMNPDGTEVKCLTCNKPAAPTGHKGQAYWHPNGEYIAFTAENEYGKHRPAYTPGVGRDNDVWIMTSDGDRYYRITHNPKDWGTIRAMFSHDGKMLSWCEEYSAERGPGRASFWDLRNMLKQGEELGLWRYVLADVAFGADGPKVFNIRHVELPGVVMLECEGFTPDDQHFVFSAATSTETTYWGDIYTSDLDGRSLTNLTNSKDLHDENAEYSPNGKKIAWMTGPFIGFLKFYKTDLYLMDSDGSNRMRLTHFNQPGHPEYTGQRHLVGETAWSPDGTRVIFHVYGEGYYTENLYMLTFEGACGK